MEVSQVFQPYQIVCLEHLGRYLYAEVIQIVENRGMLWIRPLMLAVWPSGTRDPFQESPRSLYDLREGADLVWPIHLFRLALDTEVISLFAQLENSASPAPETAKMNHQQLRGFVQQVWHAYPHVFQKIGNGVPAERGDPQAD